MNTPSYLTLNLLLFLIEEPNGSACARLLAEHRPLFERIPASRHNHHHWAGGYIDHVTDGMNYGRHLYALEESFGRPIPFSCGDVLLVFFLHGLEKPWRELVLQSSYAPPKSGLTEHSAFLMYREKKFEEYGIVLTSAHVNALRYIRGEKSDRLSTERVMNELAGFCHMIDEWSGRVRHDYPKINDEWSGAGRFRTTNTQTT